MTMEAALYSRRFGGGQDRQRKELKPRPLLTRKCGRRTRSRTNRRKIERGERAAIAVTHEAPRGGSQKSAPLTLVKGRPNWGGGPPPSIGHPLVTDRKKKKSGVVI